MLHSLSRREKEIALKVIDGLSNKAIANELYISERTVKFHCANIYKKLNIHNRTSLIANYYRDRYKEAA
nr:LuxR C-terminal-related transcriptional regulator [Glaciecola sp. MH2013]